MNESLPATPPRRCSNCTCTPGNTCLTTHGSCFWLDGSDLCGGCLFPKIRLRGPLDGDLDYEAPEGPFTVNELCADARAADPESMRWFWAVYGRAVRERLLAA
jgi:hypothetical protein